YSLSHRKRASASSVVEASNNPSPCLAASSGSSRTKRPSSGWRQGRSRGVQTGRSILKTCPQIDKARRRSQKPYALQRTRRKPNMLHTVPAFDRIGEENAFAVLARATALAQSGKDVINLGIGQPDFQTPPHIVEAAIKALRDGHDGYAPATGRWPLREAVARRVLQMTGEQVSPDNVMITPGGKPAMYAAIILFGQPGVDILYPDPGFPI